MNRAALILALCFSIAVQALEPRRVEWRDTYESRLEILALLQTINGEILAGSSATRTLEAWCGEHRLAVDPKICVLVRVLERGAVGDFVGVEQNYVRLHPGPEKAAIHEARRNPLRNVIAAVEKLGQYLRRRVCPRVVGPSRSRPGATGARPRRRARAVRTVVDHVQAHRVEQRLQRRTEEAVLTGHAVDAQPLGAGAAVELSCLSSDSAMTPTATPISATFQD